MSIEDVPRRRGIERGVKLTISEFIAGFALVITMFSALNGWIVLPEQMRHINSNDAKQDAKIEMMERTSAERSELLARIDERTRRIEEYLQSKGL
jgi:TRAP-type mannitol/chloroaromatic compound transport system substrate-binding protein